MSPPEQILFLPGASGNVDFWRPAAQRLDAPHSSLTHVGWPGFGQTPQVPDVRTIDDLIPLGGARSTVTATGSACRRRPHAPYPLTYRVHAVLA
jgi:pimeloyl-ACP methyl ester carboxylesterase